MAFLLLHNYTDFIQILENNCFFLFIIWIFSDELEKITVG